MHNFIRSAAAVPVLIFLVTGLICDDLHCAQRSHADHPIYLISSGTGYILEGESSRMIGIWQSGIGFGGRVQLTTNTLLDMMTFLNAECRVALLKEGSPFPALSLSVGYYNLVTSRMITDDIILRTFNDDDIGIDSGLDCMTFSVSVSGKVDARAGAHLTYQYYRLRGRAESEEPFEVSTGYGGMGVEFKFDHAADDHSVIAAMDLYASDRISLILETGYDFSAGAVRGAGGMRLELLRNLFLDLGLIWPGTEFEDELDIPVLPYFSIFRRF